MKETGIIFQGWGVRAIRENRKTQTRRIAKFKPLPSEQGLDVTVPSLKLGTYMTGHPETGYVLYSMRGGCWNQVTERLFCPYGVPGDRLWVREAFALQSNCDCEKPPFGDGRPIKRTVDAEWGERWHQPHYQATDPTPDLCCENPRCKCCSEGDPGPHWKPSIYMPRWASRLLLEITDVRMQRVQEISEEDAKAEGVDGFFLSSYDFDYCTMTPYRANFRREWDAINAKRGFGWDVNPWAWALTFGNESAA